MCKEMNGYTNYPTWNVALWINNSQAEQEHIYKQTRHYAEDKYPHSRFADWLSEYVGNQAEEITQSASMISDIMGWALSSVNWHELAETFMEDTKEMNL